MRNLFVLFVSCFAMATAVAKDPPSTSASVPAAAPAKAAMAPAKAAPAPAKAAPAPANAAMAPAKTAPAAALKSAPRQLSAPDQRVIDDQAEFDLQARIAARIAEMRASQVERVALAARARRASEARKRTETVEAKPVPANGTHWSYEGEFGPANWSKINSNWSRCSAGERQSPIDIRDGMKVDLEKIAFDYRPSSFSVLDNGHTIQVTVDRGNYLTVQNQTYELQQFHFHRPSEERINGKSFEMVVHLVHRDADGKLAVLAVLLERGAAHGMIQTVWNNLPLEKHQALNPSVVLDVNEVLPERREYYTYMGSLTTPPCTEGVLWMVMKQPVQASPQQMALFSRLYPFNARPAQRSAGRVIKESN